MLARVETFFYYVCILGKENCELINENTNKELVHCDDKPHEGLSKNEKRIDLMKEIDVNEDKGDKWNMDFPPDGQHNDFHQNCRNDCDDINNKRDFENIQCGNESVDCNNGINVETKKYVNRISLSSKYIEYNEQLADLTTTEREYINQAKTFYSRKCRRRRIRRIREEEEEEGGGFLTENEVVLRIREKSHALLERREKMLKKYY